MTGNLQHCHHFPAQRLQHRHHFPAPRQFVSNREEKKNKMLPKLHLIKGIVYGEEFQIQIFKFFKTISVISSHKSIP